MAFQSLDKIIDFLQRQPEWEEWREFERLSGSWISIVGEVVGKHARPIGVRHGVLEVATSNAMWAQQLTFERVQILKKLNPKLTHPLKDIRFSSARWYSRPQRASARKPSPASTIPITSPSQHQPEPSEASDLPPPQAPPPTSREAFEQWAQKIQARSQGLPLCPQCNCPTPTDELQRWTVCAPCRAKNLPQPPPGARSDRRGEGETR